MGIFDIFRKKENSSGDFKWDDFCIIDELYKDDIKLKPIYYLKKYGINEINNNIEMKDAAIKDFTSALTSSIDNNPITSCLIDYLIKREEILDNEKLIDIINNLDRDGLEKIANSHTYFSYIQTREKLNDIDNNDIKQIIKPLVDVLNNSDNNYNNFILKYSNEYKDYFLNIYKVIMDCIDTNIKFDNYDFNNGKSKIYLYENGVVAAFNDDIENVSFVFNKFKLLDRILKIKRLLFINNELFAKNYKRLIMDEDSLYSLGNEFYTKNPYYVFNDKVYGDIEFYYNDDGIELKCNALNNETFKLIQVFSYDLDGDEERLVYIHTIEKIIKMKEEILDKLYNYALTMCIEWDEKDENGNDISIEYIKKSFKFSINIYSKVINKGNDDYTEKIDFIISGYSDYLLGGHSIDAIVEDDNIKCLFQ